MNNINLSIIIPHYNESELLEKLLNSIPIQNDIEVIVIDDQSDEYLNKYKQIIKKYNYNTFHFISNGSKKKGAGVCRNIGLKNASGEWILFADSDDYFLEGFYNVISKYFNTNNDVIFFNPTSIYLDTGRTADRHIEYRDRIFRYKKNKNLKTEIDIRYKFSVPWSKLIKKEFLDKNNIKFDNVIASNDVMFSIKTGYHMDKFKVDERVIYCTTRNKGSLTVTRNKEIFDSRLNVYINKIKFLRNRLTKKELNCFTLTGQGFIFNSIKYKLGFRKIINVIKKFKKNDIPLFDKKILNPIYFIKKVINHFWIEKNNKKYISE